MPKKRCVAPGVGLLFAIALPACGSQGEAPEGVRRWQMGAYGQLPLHFEPNLGQADEAVKFLSRRSGYSLFLTSSESVLVLHKPDATEARRPAVLRMKLVGASTKTEVVGEGELPGRSHYLIGNDPAKWRKDVPQYACVRYRAVYPGIDLTYHGSERRLEYDFVVAPGGDPRLIRLRVEGAKKLRLDGEGSLVMRTEDGDVIQEAPVVYQEVDGEPRAVAGGFVLRGKEVGFEVGSYDAKRPLVIDPVLVYSTYLGGSTSDWASSIVVDASGNAYVTGGTASTNFPKGNPLQGSHSGSSSDAFVAKLNPSGSVLLYSTYLGGSNGDGGYDIAVDASGNAYVTGYTASSDFPTASPYQGSFGGGHDDAFVAKLDPSGSALVYAT